MNISTITLYIISLIFLVVSVIKDKKKTLMGIKKGYKSFKNILPLLIPLFLIVGTLLVYVTPEIISNILGDSSAWLGVTIGLLIGSIAFMPPFVTFPLGAELLANGAGYAQVAAFLTTLMGVGFVYIQAESKFFGFGSTFKRNSLAFIAAIIVAVVMEVFM